MNVSHGDAKSRLFFIRVGAFQENLSAGPLFQLHLHFLPNHFLQMVFHTFAADLTLLIKGGLEMRFSTNIKYLESHAKVVLKSL